ncbi:MAG TPA: glycosyltransferase [Arenimonas sp.]|nr:glycosyltransferase [Arenimonas sp.]
MSSSLFPVIVVPVFNAFEALDICLGSLLKTLPSGARVLLADDASTDPRVADLLVQFKSRAKFHVEIARRDENLGFPANCNAAFRETGDSDLLLLNSDTIFTSGCLEKITQCAASDASIATITPWSNNAEICSYPKFCENNPLPENLDLMAEAAALITAADLPELPTAMGFCMWIRRAALRQCGNFDADTFGRGYGEENDFCRRVAAMGWRNVMCVNAYVAHAGSASFGPLGLGPGGDNLQRLLARWPDYHEQVARFILQDPLRELREQFSANILSIQDKGPQGDLFGAISL